MELPFNVNNNETIAVVKEHSFKNRDNFLFSFDAEKKKVMTTKSMRKIVQMSDIMQIHP